MPDKSITKVNLANATRAAFEQKYLPQEFAFDASLGDEQPNEVKREYETAGFVIEGKAKLHPWCVRLPMPGRWTSQASKNAN